MSRDFEDSLYNFMKRLLQLKSLALMVLLAGSLGVQAANTPAPKGADKAKPAIELGAPFADNAILQRQMDLPVWGWSKPGTKVTVEFAGQKKSATTGKDGKWMLSLAPLKASFKPAEMVVTESTGKKVALKNILVGEVWMASGQSNMQWIAAKCDVGQILQKQIAERVEAGTEKDPVIREGSRDQHSAASHRGRYGSNHQGVGSENGRAAWNEIHNGAGLLQRPPGTPWA